MLSMRIKKKVGQFPRTIYLFLSFINNFFLHVINAQILTSINENHCSKVACNVLPLYSLQIDGNYGNVMNLIAFTLHWFQEFLKPLFSVKARKLSFY